MDTQILIEPLEVMVQEFSNRIKIEAISNCKRGLPTDHGRSVVLDLNREAIFHSLGLNLKLLVSLNLSHCKLTHLPNIFDDSNLLKELNLSHNELSDVPQMIFDTLRFLEELDISHNQISCFNGLPKCMYKLRILRLNNNCLTDIPDFIINAWCFNLEELYYSHNEITSMSSSKFLYGGPYRLKKMQLRNCILRPEDLTYLKQIRTLLDLDLSNECNKNRNTIQFCSRFEKFFQNAMWDDQLRILNLNNLQIPDLPPSISELVNLQELYLSKNNIMWLPDTIGFLTELKVLDVSKNTLFLLPSTMNKLTKLEILKADSNSISEIPDLTCLNLKHIDLYDNCLEKCCSINWNAVTLIDLGYNYFNISDLHFESYEGKKTALRQSLQLNNRTDTLKEIPNENESNIEDCFYSSEEEEYFQNDSIGDFRSGHEEESWGCSVKDCDNGCTPSDNEWTGTEPPTVKHKTKKRRQIARVPSWMLVDIE